MNIKEILLLRLILDEVIRGHHPRNRVIPLELRYIEKLLEKRRNINVKLLDQVAYRCNDYELIDIIHNTKPHIVVVSFTTLEKSKAENLIKACKNTNTIFVGIGQGVGFYSNEYVDWLIEHFDLTIPGEPEQVFISCLNKILNGFDIDRLRQEIWNKYLESGPFIVEDLDSLPVLTYKPSEIENYGYIYPIWSNKRLKWGHVLSSRGCPHNCIFCSPIMRKSYGKKMRYRNVKSVIAEITELMKFGVNIISFEDDDFTCSSKQVELICKEIIKRKLKIHWVAHARVDEVSLDLMKIMKQSGCVLLRFGVESGNQRIISYLKKGNGERWKTQTEEVFSRLKRMGIGINAMFIIGCPGEIRKEIEDTIEFAKELRPDCIQVAFFETYPGCSLFSGLRLEDKEKILNSAPYHYKDVFPNLSSVDSKELICLHKKFYRSFVLRPQFLFLHMNKYLLFYLKNQKIFKILVKGLLNYSVFKKVHS